MKHSWWSVALVVGCLVCLGFLPGCGKGGGRTPEKTVNNFFKAAQDKDIDAMLECYAPDVQEMFDKMMEIQGKDTIRKQMSGSSDELEKFKIKDTKITGDRAEVKVAVTVKGKTEEETMALSKIDGKWYVDFPEEDKKGMKKTLEMMKDPKMKEMMKKMREGLKEGVPPPEE